MMNINEFINKIVHAQSGLYIYIRAPLNKAISSPLKTIFNPITNYLSITLFII